MWHVTGIIMGYYSFKTADTDESIPHIMSDNFQGPAYLLQPDGQPPICEEEYSGYGTFGVSNVYAVLAVQNKHLFPKDFLPGIDPAACLDKMESPKVHDALFHFGLGLAYGKVFQKPGEDTLYHVFNDNRNIVPGVFLDIQFNQFHPDLGGIPNEMTLDGRLIEIPITDLVDGYRPLKFSFNESAVWEDLPASKDCPNQGFVGGLCDEADEEAAPSQDDDTDLSL